MRACRRWSKQFLHVTAERRRAKGLVAAAQRILVIGIGGGGDVVGALAAAQAARALGTDAVVGGLTWERRPVDPLPGPRRLDEITGAQPLHEAVALAGADTVGPGGFRFCEADMAAFLGEPVVLVDPNPGPAAIAAGLDAAAAQLGCDLVVLLDVGGDVLAHGHEPGLASPLADATVLAAAPRMATPTIGIVFGIGCDGELTPAEVLERLDEVACRRRRPRRPAAPGRRAGAGRGRAGARHHRGQRDGRPLRPRRDRPGPDPRRPALRAADRRRRPPGLLRPADRDRQRRAAGRRRRRRADRWRPRRRSSPASASAPSSTTSAKRPPRSTG